MTSESSTDKPAATSIREFFQEANLPEPWLPPAMPAKLEALGDMFWTSEPNAGQPDEDVSSLVQSLVTDARQYLSLGVFGRGINNWRLVYALADSQLIFVSVINFSPLEMTDEDRIAEMERLNLALGDLSALRDRVVAAGKWPAGQRLLVVRDPFNADSCGLGWTDGSWPLPEKDWMASEGVFYFCIGYLEDLL